MKLTTKVKNSIIIFIDGSKKSITSEVAEKISLLPPGAGQIDIDGSFIKLHSISKILTLEEYYNQYPSERPKQYDLKEEYVSHIQNPTPKARNSMLKGLKQYCDENLNALKAKAMYSRLLDKKAEVDDYWLEVHAKYKDKDRTDSEERHFQHALSKINI